MEECEKKDDEGHPAPLSSGTLSRNTAHAKGWKGDVGGRKPFLHLCGRREKMQKATIDLCQSRRRGKKSRWSRALKKAF